MEGFNNFVGFGFGAIQGGLFVYEAFQADPTRRLVVAEVIPEIVKSIRQSNGTYYLNIAYKNKVEIVKVENIDIQNPNEENGRFNLIEAVAKASEVSTALPSVEFYHQDGINSVSQIIAEGLVRKIDNDYPPVIIYTAENNNLAAEILEEKVRENIPGRMQANLIRKAQFVNTVIGKMSQVINDIDIIQEEKMAPITRQLNRAFLVESFNRIQISRLNQVGQFRRGIPVFEEKDDLLRFEEAKLYGHNATHALMGYLCAMAGIDNFSNIPEFSGILPFAREAFLQESGKALIMKYHCSDVLFSENGFQDYVDDLSERMINPYLRDKVERVTRDTYRKLAWNDRLIGTIRMALQSGIYPERFLIGTLAAIYFLDDKVLDQPDRISKLLHQIWDTGERNKEEGKIIRFLLDACLPLKHWVSNGFRNLNAHIPNRYAQCGLDP